LIDVPLAMRILFSLLFAAIFALGASAHARMYQWVDGESGNVRLSGEPPSWYRSGERGPRVLVFEDGRLVDDTSIGMPLEQRKAYREAAFLEADLRRERDAVKKLERAALREARRRDEAKRRISAQLDAQPDSKQTGASEDTKSGEALSASSPAELDGGVVEQLKALISTWDQQNSSGKNP
jgi:hypothetical protein